MLLIDIFDLPDVSHGKHAVRQRGPIFRGSSRIQTEYIQIRSHVRHDGFSEGKSKDFHVRGEIPRALYTQKNSLAVIAKIIYVREISQDG